MSLAREIKYRCHLLVGPFCLTYASFDNRDREVTLSVRGPGSRGPFHTAAFLREGQILHLAPNISVKLKYGAKQSRISLIVLSSQRLLVSHGPWHDRELKRVK
jgi:hypothetical protein